MRQDAFLAAIDETAIVAAIQQAEARSRGEIRVHVAEGLVSDPRRAAEADFERLGMTATAERNGVLVLIAPESRSFAVIGDRGIHERVPEGFWDALAAELGAEFASGRFTSGIVRVVGRVADELERHFPRRPGDADVNELPDSVSRD